MSGFERPAPDVSKISTAWQAWCEGGDDVFPGRTMADLKIGGVDVVIEALVVDAHEAISPIADAWTAWERGKAGPVESLAALVDHGFGDIVEALAAEA